MCYSGRGGEISTEGGPWRAITRDDAKRRFRLGYALRAPGMTPELPVTTDPDYYEEHSESVEFWSPGNPLFNPPESLGSGDETNQEGRLRELLDNI